MSLLKLFCHFTSAHSATVVPVGEIIQKGTKKTFHFVKFRLDELRSSIRLSDPIRSSNMATVRLASPANIAWATQCRHPTCRRHQATSTDGVTIHAPKPLHRRDPSARSLLPSPAT